MKKKDTLKLIYKFFIIIGFGLISFTLGMVASVKEVYWARIINYALPVILGAGIAIIWHHDVVSLTEEREVIRKYYREDLEDMYKAQLETLDQMLDSPEIIGDLRTAKKLVENKLANLEEKHVEERRAQRNLV